MKLVLVVVLAMISYIGWAKWNEAIATKRIGLSKFEPSICERLEGDCRRGFSWSQARELRNGNECLTGVSEGFYQGCLMQVGESLSDLEPDDVE
jgi:hypothetical protein